MEPREYAILAAEAAAEKKAEEIVVMDVGELLVVTDYFVICTGRNDRQVRTIAEEVELKLKQVGLRAIGVEGADEGKWILVDFADVVLHVFQPDEREFYRLEKLWGEAGRLALPESVTGPAGPLSSADGPDASRSAAPEETDRS